MKKKLAFIMELKNVKRGRIKEYAEKYKVEYHKDQKPWGVKCDIALPCATQNDLDAEAAKTLIDNGCIAICEGADMPCTREAIKMFQQAKLLFAPSKASTAAAISISGLEILEVSKRLSKRSGEEIDLKLDEAMQGIHERCVKYGKNGSYIDYAKGANIGGFVKVANAIIEQGLV